MTPYATLERLWPGETVVCMATGPSLCQADVDAVRGQARVIVINDAYDNKATSCLWADVLFASDDKWWGWHQGAPNFTGRKYVLEHVTQPPPKIWPGVEVLKNFGRTGLSLDPTGVKTGHDSGYQAINIASLCGAARILLLGYDMHAKGKDHCFGAHRDRSRPHFETCLEAYPTLVEPLKRAGVEILNCTPGSALRCFPMASLQDALIRRAA